MGKTPFELRFDILNLARQQVVDRYFADLEVLRATLDAVGDSHSLKTHAPDFPSIENIFEVAEKFKQFVEDKLS